MNRLAFLRSLALGTGGLLLGEEALEAFARLTHQRTMFPGAAIRKPLHQTVYQGKLFTVYEGEPTKIYWTEGNREDSWTLTQQVEPLSALIGTNNSLYAFGPNSVRPLNPIWTGRIRS